MSMYIYIYTRIYTFMYLPLWLYKFICFKKYRLSDPSRCVVEETSLGIPKAPRPKLLGFP